MLGPLAAKFLRAAMRRWLRLQCKAREEEQALQTKVQSLKNAGASAKGPHMKNEPQSQNNPYDLA